MQHQLLPHTLFRCLIEETFDCFLLHHVIAIEPVLKQQLEVNRQSFIFLAQFASMQPLTKKTFSSLIHDTKIQRSFLVRETKIQRSFDMAYDSFGNIQMDSQSLHKLRNNPNRTFDIRSCDCLVDQAANKLLATFLTSSVAPLVQPLVFIPP